MSWVDKAHRENKLHKEIDRALSSPKYQREEKKKLDEEYRKALDCFLLISADYLYRQGYRKKRLLKFIKFVVYQMHCVETDPDYFRLLNDAMAEETGVDILKNLVRERSRVRNKQKSEHKYPHPKCFTPEENNPYPLCIGKELPECKDCQIRADWEPEDPYGVGD